MEDGTERDNRFVCGGTCSTEGERKIYVICEKRGKLLNTMRPRKQYRIKYNHWQLFGNAFIHFSLTYNILGAFQHTHSEQLTIWLCRWKQEL